MVIVDSVALSCCSNWEAFQQLNQGMCSFQQFQAEFPNELFSFGDSFCTPNSSIDLYLETEDFMCAQENAHLLPQHIAPNPLVSLPQDVFPNDEMECYQYPKRVRYCDELYSPEFMFNSFDGPFFPSCLVPGFSPEYVFQPVELQIPADLRVGDESSKKTSAVCLSAQSAAARQRRKKISEKTQELGKLIPGGSKMNTAEMFQAAYKYVKYMQAQVGILGLINSTQENKDTSNLKEIHGVVASPRIREKLYEEEKCIVPKAIVQAFVKDQELQPNPSICKDLNNFLQSMES